MMNKRRILASFVVGGLLGSLFGLMIAPYSGKETRKKITKNSKKLRKILLKDKG